jgi:hypothetical protein
MLSNVLIVFPLVSAIVVWTLLVLCKHFKYAPRKVHNWDICIFTVFLVSIRTQSPNYNCKYLCIAKVTLVGLCEMYHDLQLWPIRHVATKNFRRFTWTKNFSRIIHYEKMATFGRFPKTTYEQHYVYTVS